MIDAIKYTPAEYSKQSRDYQVVSRLFTILFNNVKMYADEIANIWTDDIDDSLLHPRSSTLNFDVLHDWENIDLEGVTNCFKYLERLKGTRTAILMCIHILARLKGISLVPDDEAVEIVDNVIIIKVSENIADIGIIEDLLRVILPAGMLYRIIKYKEIDSTARTNILVSTKLFHSDFIKNKYLGIYGDSELWASGDVNYSIDADGNVIFDSEGKFVYNKKDEVNIITNNLILQKNGSEEL